MVRRRSRTEGRRPAGRLHRSDSQGPVHADALRRGPTFIERAKLGAELLGAGWGLKSPYTLGHSRGVAELAEGAARDYGLPADECKRLRRAGLVHDLGRLGVSNATGQARRVDSRGIRAGTAASVPDRADPRVVANSRPAGRACRRASRATGRRRGYLRGLAGNALSPASRILAVADENPTRSGHDRIGPRAPRRMRRLTFNPRRTAGDSTAARSIRSCARQASTSPAAEAAGWPHSARNHQTLCDSGAGPRSANRRSTSTSRGVRPAGRLRRPATCWPAARRTESTAPPSNSRRPPRIEGEPPHPARSTRADAVVPTGSGMRRPPRECDWQATARYRPARADNPSRPVARGVPTASAPSGARVGDDARIRSVRYGCSRTRSNSAGVNAPGLSHIAFDTPRRPRSCTKPARRSRLHSLVGSP